MRVLKLNEFFSDVHKWIEYLAYGNFSFDEYLEISKKNRRVRNAFVYFAISKEDYAARFFQLALTDNYVYELKYDLHKALLKVKNDDLYRDEVIEVASKLLIKHFDGREVDVDYEAYDVPAEMAKFLAGLVNDYYIELEMTDEKRAYVEEMYKKIDWNNLFVKFKPDKK